MSLDPFDLAERQDKYLSLSEFEIVIPAIQDGKKINPIPYQRTTQNSKWSKNYQRYAQWKAHLQGNFIAKFSGLSEFLKIGAKEPIPFCEPFYSFARIYFMNKRHGDPDNVWKGANDALFRNDKLVCGGCLYAYDPDNPRLELYLKRLSKKEDEINYRELSACVTKTFLKRPS